MGLLQNIRQLFAASEVPVGGKIFKLETVEMLADLKYDYKTIEELMADERVYAIVSLVSAMVQNAYTGPNLRPKNKYLDDKLDSKEEKAIELADKFARDMKIKRKFFSYAWQIVSHGDMFEKIIKDGKNGITGVDSLPLNSVKAVENQAQAKSSSSGIQILKENMIAVRASETDSNPTFYKLDKKEYFHLSFKNHAVWREDIDKVDTYGIYSIPPLASLQNLVNWKKKTIENDILWKSKLLPRLKHVLKMPSIVPSKYQGTQTEKVAAAQADATRIMNDFIESTKRLRPDDDIVESDAVETTMLEAHSTNYMRPNETISQINTFLNTPQGIPTGLLGGESGASLGLEISAIFTGIRVDVIANLIADAWNELMQSHLRIINPGLTDEVIERVYIHIDASLTVERFEKLKTASTANSTGAFTKGEIREMTGYPRLPQLPESVMASVVTSDARTTVREIQKDINQEKPNSNQNNRSPQGDRNTSEGDKFRDNSQT